MNAERSDDELPAPGASQHGLRAGREREERETSPATASKRDAERTIGAGTGEPVSDPGADRTTPGQRASTRRGASRRAAATGPAGAEPTSAERTGAEPASAEPTRTMPTGASLPSTPAELPAIPTPADPPTTELRGTVAAEPSFSPPVPTPAAAPVPTNIYRARRPGVAILLIIPAVAVGVLLVQSLVSAALDDPVGLAGIIASVCALVSLPLVVAGVYGLVSGAAHGAEHYGFKVWARPPLAYLLVGLAFVVAAALAAG